MKRFGLVGLLIIAWIVYMIITTYRVPTERKDLKNKTDGSPSIGADGFIYRPSFSLK